MVSLLPRSLHASPPHRLARPLPQDPEAVRAAVRPSSLEPFSAVEFIQKVGKGKPTAGIVEAVLNGSTLRVTLLPDLTQVRAPGGGGGRMLWLPVAGQGRGAETEASVMAAPGPEEPPPQWCAHRWYAACSRRAAAGGACDVRCAPTTAHVRLLGVPRR